MTSTVCTLFEGSYHYGVGALTNSLVRQGFRGTIFAGYRGALPPWASPLQSAAEFRVCEGCVIRFVPVETERHLTNYKPDFMLKLWEAHCPEADSLFFFDPDIVIRCGWAYFEAWAKRGVALCEDVNSPIPISHPLRQRWREIYADAEMNLTFASDIYVNAGFIGVHREYLQFLVAWRAVQEVMSTALGGLTRTNLEVGGREHPFAKTDQDALNITLGATAEPLSCIGKEGMDLIPGGFTMSHSIGTAKGWTSGILRNALAGYPPSAAIKQYFAHVETPICLYSPRQLRCRRPELRLAAMLGRFYRRS